MTQKITVKGDTVIEISGDCDIEISDGSVKVKAKTTMVPYYYVYPTIPFQHYRQFGGITTSTTDWITGSQAAAWKQGGQQ